MTATERLIDRGSRRGDKTLATLGEELRNRRLELGLSQRVVAAAARLDRSAVSQIERGRRPSFTIINAARISAVLGLDLWLKVFDGPGAVRDAAQAEPLHNLVSVAQRPLAYRLEVPLPAREGAMEQRRWDAVLTGTGARTAIEYESRLYDSQGQLGRINLKRRDDPTEHFLLVIADTRTNRRALAAAGGMLSDLLRLRSSFVRRQLASGRHPGTGFVLLGR